MKVARTQHGGKLIVLCQRAEQLAAFLSPAASDQLRLVESFHLQARSPFRGLRTSTCASAETPIVSVPVDGPRHAAELAIALLRSRGDRMLLAVAVAGGAPPPWWSIDLVAQDGVPAVDLRDMRWHDRDGLWFVNDSGPVRVPIRVQGSARAHAASMLLALQGAASAPAIRRWLDEVAAGRPEPEVDQWESLLCATYLNAAAARW